MRLTLQHRMGRVEESQKDREVCHSDDNAATPYGARGRESVGQRGMSL